MGLFSRRKKEARAEETTPVTTTVATTTTYPSWMQSSSTPMLLSTVYRCVDLISGSLAVLPLELYRLDADGFKEPLRQTELYDILNLEPNELMSRSVMFKTMAASTLLKGNAYAYIERENGQVTQLVYIPADYVSIEFIPVGGHQRKRYRITGYPYYPVSGLIDPQDMIHVLNFSYDGIVGVSTLTHARQTLGIASDSEAHASGFFKSGGNLSGVLTMENVRLTQEQRDQIYKTWEARTNPVTGKPNGIVVLEGNQKYQTISVSPKDAQLLESRQFNVVDICRFFSVSPVKAFDLTKSSYSTIEASQIEYLNDTLLPIITKFEDEINRKIFLRQERKTYKAEFNTQALLRTDKKSQAAYWNTLFQIGAAKPNEIRRENNLQKVEGGDQTFVQVNVQTLDNAVNSKEITQTTQNSDGTE